MRIAKPEEQSIVAGYSKRSLADKLGIRAGMKAHLIGAAYSAPAGAKILKNPGAGLDFIHLFTRERSELEKRFPPLARSLAPAGMLWVSRPKKASKVETDLDENVVREIGLRSGLVDVQVCAVDEIWSGLKFVIRLKDR